MSMTAVKFFITLSGLAFVLYGGSVFIRKAKESAPPVHAEVAASYPTTPVKHFKLTDQDGQEFDSQSLDGQVWLASFFFTNCPAVCWRLNQALSTLQTELPKEVQLVSLTCDPENDRPEVLAKYAKHFKAEPGRWHFLTGEMAALHTAAGGFQVTLEKMLHSDRVFVIDRGGIVRGSYRITETGETARLLKKVRQVVEQSPPTEAAVKPSESESATSSMN